MQLCNADHLGISQPSVMVKTHRGNVTNVPLIIRNYLIYNLNLNYLSHVLIVIQHFNHYLFQIIIDNKNMTYDYYPIMYCKRIYCIKYNI